jgi:hypothetical protein
MKQLLESMSLASGTVIAAVFCAALAWPLSLVRSATLRWTGGVAIPLALAYALYWSPVWLGADDRAQYSAWQLLVVPVWFVAGGVSSAIVLLIVRKKRRERNPR